MKKETVTVLIGNFTESMLDDLQNLSVDSLVIAVRHPSQLKLLARKSVAEIEGMLAVGGTRVVCQDATHGYFYADVEKVFLNPKLKRPVRLQVRPLTDVPVREIHSHRVMLVSQHSVKPMSWTQTTVGIADLMHYL